MTALAMVSAYGPSSQAQRQSLYVDIDPYTYSYEVRRSPQSHSPASSTSVSLDSAGTSSNDAGTPLCAVLCMYDWSSDDPDYLSFVQNEILDVVKQEDSGWWAAMRSDSEIGWIPQAYVERLSNEMAEKLRQTPMQFRCKEYQAEQLYTNLSPIYDPIEPLSPSPPSPRINRRERDTSQLSKLPRVHDPDSTYRLVFQRFQTDQNASHQAQASHSYTSYSQKPTQFISHVDQDSSSVRHRAGTIPISITATTTARRRDEPASATVSRPVYELHNPDVAFSKSKNAIEGLIKRNQSSVVAHTFLDEKPLHRIAEPWTYKPLYADQLEFDEDGQLRFGTVKALVEKLTCGKLNSNLQQCTDNSFCHVFLTTFRTFMTSDELFDMLLEAFQMGDQPKDLATAEIAEWKQHLISTQTRVLEVFSSWLCHHRLLQDDAHIAQKLTSFLERIKAPPLALISRHLEEQIHSLTFSINPPTRSLPKKVKKPKSHKNDLLRLDPADIAEQLTLMESERYVKVTPKECLLYNKHATTTNLAKFCSTHDKIVSWVKSSVLTHEALGKRASTIEFWIKVAEVRLLFVHMVFPAQLALASQKCKAMNNFASMSAVINALSSTVITRLHLTWAHVGRKNILDGLLKHNEPTGGFAGYRNLLQNVEGPCVPFISMYLTDLVHIQDAFGDEPGGRICFLQRQRSYQTVNAMLRFQSRPHDIAESESVMGFIKRSLQADGERDNNYFWAKSQEVQQMELAHADIRKGLEAAGF
ncbi:hypothetical protein C0992_008343 [Termitomyces sp. T32_za158]|nr:hypothetical protein C0992_008343 [Termitomyces sp. T32_za158]